MKAKDLIGPQRAALVTGGSSGIGLAVARLLARRGSNVWLMARDPNRLDAAQSLLESDRQNPDQMFGVLVADVSESEQVANAISKVVDAVGTPHLVINSAGVALAGIVQELELDSFRWMINVNYLGTLYVTKQVVPGMLARGHGHIVNISSLAGVVGFIGYTAYGASKFAVRGFSDALRAELKPHGVGVSIVYPPDTDTPQFEYESQLRSPEMKAILGVSKVLPADAVAAAILNGVSRGKYVIIPGLEGNLLYWLSGFIGTGVYPILDWLIAKASKNTRTSQ